jgi:hypothetical protein
MKTTRCVVLVILIFFDEHFFFQYKKKRNKFFKGRNQLVSYYHIFPAVYIITALVVSLSVIFRCLLLLLHERNHLMRIVIVIVYIYMLTNEMLSSFV